MSCNGCLNYVDGAVQATLSIAGVDLARPETIRFRRQICRACPNGVGGTKGIPHVCTVCHCLTRLKTRLRKQACQFGMWTAEKPNGN